MVFFTFLSILFRWINSSIELIENFKLENILDNEFEFLNFFDLFFKAFF